MMRIRYSSIPVVIAPHQMALGGGCEMCLHADKVVAHAELYMGLVEFGVGLIPGGGGTKEFALRLSDELQEGDVELNNFRDRFLTIGQAKVSTSAYEAFELGILKRAGIGSSIARQVACRSKTAMPANGKRRLCTAYPAQRYQGIGQAGPWPWAMWAPIPCTAVTTLANMT
jgi:enoyl-CoA hydratase/carnithine racemase